MLQRHQHRASHRTLVIGDYLDRSRQLRLLSVSICKLNNGTVREVLLIILPISLREVYGWTIPTRLSQYLRHLDLFVNTSCVKLSFCRCSWNLVPVPRVRGQERVYSALRSQLLSPHLLLGCEVGTSCQTPGGPMPILGQTIGKGHDTSDTS